MAGSVCRVEYAVVHRHEGQRVRARNPAGTGARLDGQGEGERGAREVADTTRGVNARQWDGVDGARTRGRG
jgi:hypothetical protein